jgi:hypothetical protein
MGGPRPQATVVHPTSSLDEEVTVAKRTKAKDDTDIGEVVEAPAMVVRRATRAGTVRRPSAIGGPAPNFD